MEKQETLLELVEECKVSNDRYFKTDENLSRAAGVEKMTAEEINKYIEHFIPIYNDKGKEINAMPNNTKITVWCDNGQGDEGFAYDTTTLDMGINAFIAVSWILQSDLEKLAANSN